MQAPKPKHMPQKQATRPLSHLARLNHLIQDLCIRGHPSVAQHVHHGIRVCKHVVVEPAHIQAGRGAILQRKQGTRSHISHTSKSHT